MFENIKPIDPKQERRRRRLIALFVFLALFSGYLYYSFKNYPEERQAKHFFEALQHRDFQGAYQIWQPSPSYTFNDFLQDWGEDGLQGPVQQFHITGSTARGSGVVVRIRVNENQNVSLWVEKRDKSLSFPP